MAPSSFIADKSEAEVRAAERVLKTGTWAITAGAILFSVLTVTPLVESVTPEEWQWTAPILPIVVDAAVVIVIQLDSVISRLGGSGGPWPALLRWMTGFMTLLLNVGNSALHHDWVGVAVHSTAPLLLIVTAKAGLAYRRAISDALSRIQSENAAAVERQRQEREAAEQKKRADEERVTREAAEREEARLREEREHALALEKERTEREVAERKDAGDREEARLHAEREYSLRMERERAERQARADKEKADREERAEAARRRDERQEKERLAALTPQPIGISLAKASTAQTVTAKLLRPARAVEAVVMDNEFAGMTQSDAERALFDLYRAARNANTFADWEKDNPLFAPGGELCGSNLGRRLGRTDAAGRTNVKPKFERWYQESKEQAQEKEGLVGAS